MIDPSNFCKTYIKRLAWNNLAYLNLLSKICEFECVDTLYGIEAFGTLISLDVEPLFTNFPIEATIDITIK